MSFDLALIDSDIKIKSDGTIRIVEETAKLQQDIVKIILTPVGSVKHHTWYGSNIGENNIGNILPDDILFNNLDSALQDSLQKLVQLQRVQSTQQRVSTSELIAAIREVNVQRNPNDPRQINVVVRVISKSLQPVEEIFTIRG